MSNSGVQIIYWVAFLFTLHSPLPESISARSLLVLPNQSQSSGVREWQGDIQLSSSNAGYQCVASKYCSWIIKKTAGLAQVRLKATFILLCDILELFR